MMAMQMKATFGWLTSHRSASLPRAWNGGEAFRSIALSIAVHVFVLVIATELADARIERPVASQQPGMNVRWVTLGNMAAGQQHTVSPEAPVRPVALLSPAEAVMDRPAVSDAQGPESQASDSPAERLEHEPDRESAAAESPESSSSTAAQQNAGPELVARSVDSAWVGRDAVASGRIVSIVAMTVPDGTIVGVQVIASSGDASVDRSAVAAVWRVGKIVVPNDPAQYEARYRVIHLTFSRAGVAWPLDAMASPRSVSATR